MRDIQSYTGKIHSLQLAHYFISETQNSVTSFNLYGRVQNENCAAINLKYGGHVQPIGPFYFIKFQTCSGNNKAVNSICNII